MAKQRLRWVSPADLALLFSIFSLVSGIAAVIFAFFAMRAGGEVTLRGFLNLSFTGELTPIALALSYPIINACLGYIAGLVVGFAYNLFARLVKPISIGLETGDRYDFSR
jgi:hypothetical protein